MSAFTRPHVASSHPQSRAVVSSRRTTALTTARLCCTRRTGLQAACLLVVLGVLAAGPELLAQQWVPSPVPVGDVAVRGLATDIFNAAEHTRQVASEARRPGDRAQLMALTDLAALSAAAREFRDQVELFPREPERARAGYARLVEQYNQARRSLAPARFDLHVMRDFNRIGVLLERMAGMYAQPRQVDLVRAAAAEFEDATLRAVQTAMDQARPDVAVHHRAMFHLQRLSASARFFNRQLGMEMDPAQTGDDLRLLLDDYGRATRSLYISGLDRHVRGDIDRAGQALVRLSRSYHVAWNWPEVRRMADQIRVAAEHLQSTADEGMPYADFAESRALRDLADLVFAARELQRRLDVVREQPEGTYQQVLILRAAYDRASLTVPSARFDHQIGEDFARLGFLIGQLERMYAGEPWLLAPPRGPAVFGEPIQR